MQQTQNLYDYLYQSLASQIKCGTFRFDQTLPPQQEICNQYNVGITTVRKVMKMLDQDGYIRTSLGQTAVVCFQASTQTYINNLVRRRDGIKDAYQGLGLLMPVLYQEGAKQCGEQELQHLHRIIDNITDQLTLSELYQQANAFFTVILRPFQNQLVMDLELDSENYLHIPYISIPNVDAPFSLTATKLKQWLQNAATQIAKKEFDAFFYSILQFYHNTSQKIDEYLYSISFYAEEVTPIENELKWFRIKEHSELYARLAMTIMRQIASGEFDNQKYLPSIPKLMELYGVTKNTASRAITLLNLLGAAKTIDKKGTIITNEKNEKKVSCVNFKDPLIQQKLLLCLNALEIMALTVRNCATTFTAISEDWISNMEKKLCSVPVDRISPLSVQLLMNCSIHLAPCHSLQNIYKQLNELMIWGYYLQSLDEALYPDSNQVESVMKEVIAAFHAENTEHLPLALEKAFMQIYHDVRTAISLAVTGTDPYA